jgi:hypothetical protein
MTAHTTSLDQHAESTPADRDGGGVCDGWRELCRGPRGDHLISKPKQESVVLADQTSELALLTSSSDRSGIIVKEKLVAEPEAMYVASFRSDAGCILTGRHLHRPKPTRQ